MCSPRGNLLRATRTRYVSITRAFASTGKLCGCTDRSPTDYFIFIHTSNLIRRGYESVELNSRVYNTCVCVYVCVYHAFLSQGEWGYVLHARDYTVASNGCALFAWTVSNSFVFPPEFDKLFYRDGVRKITFRNLVWRMIIFFVSFFFFLQFLGRAINFQTRRDELASFLPYVFALWIFVWILFC